MTLTVNIAHNLDANVRQILTNTYQGMLSNMWWQKIAKVLPTNTRKEIFYWFLESARIQATTAGQVRFDELAMHQYEIDHDWAGAGHRIMRSELEDVDVVLQASGQAKEWARQIGIQMAYWPQKAVADAIKANATTYDNLPMFSAAHLINPTDASIGTFSNLFTTAGSGALPIHSAVTIDVAVTNLFTAVTQIGNIPTANGVDPRNLEVKGILAPEALRQRVMQIMGAKFYGQPATGGTATADVSMLTEGFNLGTPIFARELGAAYGGSDSTYYLLAGEPGDDDLGAFIYVQRQAFEMISNTPQSDAELAKTKIFEWVIEGRNAVRPGHPFKIFRCGA